MADELRHMNLETWKRQVFEDGKDSESGPWLFDAEAPHDVVLIKDVETCVKEVNRDRREVTIAYSAESIDRDGDVIRQKGIDLKAYRKNPVVLFAHGRGMGQLPVARSMKLFRSEDGLKSFSVDRFTEADVNQLGDTVFRMLSSTPAFLNAASIGFLPLKVEEREVEDDEQGRFWAPADFKKVEKLEHSIVPVPANSDALRGAKSAGIDLFPIKTWAEGVLDLDDKDPLLTREHLERCYQIANNNRRTFSVPEIKGEQDEVPRVEEAVAIDDEVSEIIASFEAEPKEEDVAEETTKTEESTSKVSLGTIEVDLNVSRPHFVEGKETEVSEPVGETPEVTEEGVNDVVEETLEEANKEEADEVFDVNITDPELEGFDFPSIKDEEVATGEPVEIQVAELRQGLRDVTTLVKKLVDAIKLTGSPETSEPELEDKGDEVLFVLADEPEKEEEPLEKVGQFITEETTRAVAGAVGRHTGRLPIP